MLKESETIIHTFTWGYLQFSTQRGASSVSLPPSLNKPVNMNQANNGWEGEPVNYRDFYNMVINYIHLWMGLPFRAWLLWYPELGRVCYNLTWVRSPKAGLIIGSVFKINIDVRTQTVVMGWTLLPYFQMTGSVYYIKRNTEQRSNHWRSLFQYFISAQGQF